MDSKIKFGVVLLVVALALAYFGHDMRQFGGDDLFRTVNEVESRQSTGMIMMVMSFFLGAGGIKSILVGMKQ